MRVLVCGGREYGMPRWPHNTDTCEIEYAERQRVHLETTLDLYLDRITHLIQGWARGADTLARNWAIKNNIQPLSFPVTPYEWGKFGKRAGFLRNQRMLKEGEPDLVIAFPGGAGTDMMVKLAREAGVEVKIVEDCT